jgi:hypothetical protein
LNIIWAAFGPAGWMVFWPSVGKDEFLEISADGATAEVAGVCVNSVVNGLRE